MFFVIKGSRAVGCELWTHVLGWELRLTSGAALLQSQVCRAGRRAPQAPSVEGGGDQNGRRRTASVTDHTAAGGASTRPCGRRSDTALSTLSHTFGRIVGLPPR